MDAVTSPPGPVNEPVLDYAPGSPERAQITSALKDFDSPLELHAYIGGEFRRPSGERFDVVAPFDHARVLGHSAHAVQADAEAAIDAALTAAPAWR